MKLESSLRDSAAPRTVLPWHTLSATEVISRLLTDAARGLSAGEAEERLRRYGSNMLPGDARGRWWRQLWGQVRSPLIIILLIAAAVTGWLGDVVALAIILLSVVVNVIIGFVQERRSQAYLERLRNLAATEAWVIREGMSVFIDPSQLVPGDIIRLKAGSRVPADARIIETHRATSNEALLSGESEAVHKQVETMSIDTPVADRKNMLWLGAMLESGETLAVVVATGRHTELGVIAQLTTEARDPRTPLMERLHHLTLIITGVVIAAAILVFILGFIKGESRGELFTTAVAVAVSAVPEGLAAALSVVLAVATARILRCQGLVRRPIAAETLGSVTVLCVDKTGTLTEGIMRVTNLVTEGPLPDMLLGMALANEAGVEQVAGKQTIQGEATDRAKLAYALDQGLDLADVKKSYPRYALLPFSSATNVIASFHEDRGSGRCFVSGAPEAVAARCTFLPDGRSFDQPIFTEMLKMYERLAADGYRVIAVADRLLPNRLKDDEATLGAVLRELTWRGLVVLQDPIRNEVRQVLDETRRAGVQVVMLTGDHRLTAMTIGRSLGFRVEGEHVVEGVMVEAWSDEELQAHLPGIDCFVRVSPAQKLRIVRGWQALGASVAMTGDGVNDAPAVAAADIGVATGTATDVTREAADLVLLNDSFVTIAGTIREGRIAFENMQKVAIQLLSGSFTALALVVTALLFGLPLPLTATQILWGNLIENGLPTFALAFEPGEADVMDRRPISRTAPILDRLGRAIVFLAPFRDLLLVALFAYLIRVAAYDLMHARTVMLAIMGTDSLLYVFAIKSLRRPLWQTSWLNNPFLLFAGATGLTLTFLAIYAPFMNTFLGTKPLLLNDWGMVLVIAFIDISLIELAKWHWREPVVTNSPQILQT